MKDILLKYYRSRAEWGKRRFTAGRQCVIMSMAKPAGTDASKHGFLRSHGIKKWQIMSLE